MDKSQALNNLQVAWIKTICELSRYVAIPDDIAVKTYAYYSRVLTGLVQTLYNDKIAQFDFVSKVADLIQAQLTRAWNEGMRANGLDPATEMEPEWKKKLQDLILSEYNYVDGFASDIVKARQDESGVGILLSRASMWANRYNDVVNIAIATTKEQKLVWRMGATEKHCSTCYALNGIVAFASEWDLAGVRPQSPPNDALECGGWLCQCRLTPTNARKTRNAWSRIMGAL